MPLPMARPVKRPTSTFHQFRQRIPADILERARGSSSLAIPLGHGVVSLTVSGTAETVQFSLRTRDPKEAKARQSAAAAYLERVWQGLRDGPARLSQRNVVALAGEIYAAWMGVFEDDPGPPELWARVKDENQNARNGSYGIASLLLTGDDADRRRAAMEARFGAFVEGQLALRALRVDDETRTRLLDAFGQALDEAATRLERNAGGDYRRDENADRFPEWRNAAPSLPVLPSLTFKALVDGWWKEAQAGGLTLSTFESYSATAAKLASFLRHTDAERVTADDIIRFKDHRLASINPRTGKPISAVTVKDNDLAGLKALFGWAVNNRKLPLNPAVGITVKIGKRIQTRGKGLTEAEAIAILKAANAPAGAAVRAKMIAARRWVPWLMAYTGARLGEMVQLRGQDVRQIEGFWTLNITPEAGTVKDKEARIVVLHPHLIEMGFPAFARHSGDGHLFLTLSRAGDWRGPWRGVKNRIQEMARAALDGADVAPNHGWRHRFKTVGRSVRIEAALLDYITGHAPATVGDSYGEHTLAVQAEAIARLPRYQVD